MDKKYKIKICNQKLIMPEELNEIFGNKIWMCKGISSIHKKVLFLFSDNAWNTFIDKLNALPSIDNDIKNFKYYFVGSCFDIDINKDGFELPKMLSDFLLLEEVSENTDIYVEYISQDSEYRYSDYIMWIDY